MNDLEFRTHNAIEQLLRYGHAVENEHIAAVLEQLGDVNDDLVNGRESAGICEHIDRAINQLNALKDEIK